MDTRLRLPSPPKNHGDSQRRGQIGDAEEQNRRFEGHRHIASAAARSQGEKPKELELAYMA